MKKTTLICLAVICLLLSACGNKNAFVPDYESAIGIIMINDEQTIPMTEKMHANFKDHQYRYDLDAALVFFFQANEEESYAGSQRLSKLQFAADIDSKRVGAVGTIGYRKNSASPDMVSVFYLYHDETGVYFDPQQKVEQVQLRDQMVVTGTDYTCKLTFLAEEPVSTLDLFFQDKEGNAMSTAVCSSDEVSDHQKFSVAGEVSAVSVVSRRADGSEISTQQITPDNNGITIYTGNDGLILDVKTLLFVWE